MLKQPAWPYIAEQLRALGFRKRAGEVYTTELGEDLLGWIGLNRATKYTGVGEYEVNPVIGIRHQRVEKMVADLRGDKFHAYLPPTISSPLGYLMPEARYRQWLVTSSVRPAGAGELIADIEHYAPPFLNSAPTLTDLCELMDQRIGIEDQLVYRRPVAWMLAGRPRHAASLLDRTETDLGSRDDPAALQLRNFISAFRQRLGGPTSETQSGPPRAVD
jgi:hypothetical protein